MLFKQLSHHWQEKVIKEETTRSDGKDWVRLNCQGKITREEVEDFLDSAGVEPSKLESKVGGFMIKCRNSQATQKLLAMTGESIKGHSIRLSRASIPLSTKAIFQLVADHLRVKEEAAARRREPGRSKWGVGRLEEEGSELSMEIEPEPTRVVQAIQDPPPAPKPSAPVQTTASTVAPPQNRNRNPKPAAMPQGQWAQGPPRGQWNQSMPADGWYQAAPPQWGVNNQWGADA